MAITFQTIQSTTLGSNQSGITFSSIPNTYTDLYLYVSARTNRTNAVDAISLKINGITTSSNYYMTFGWGGGIGSITPAYVNAQDELAYVDGNSAVSDKFGASFFRINGYTDASYGKHIAVLSGALGSSANTTRWNFGGSYSNTAAAITSIEVIPISGTQLIATSSATLYGIKKA